jgi:hypothetical protein
MPIQKANICLYVKLNMEGRVPMSFEPKTGVEYEKTGSYRIFEVLLCL